MREVSDLLQEHDRVWFYIADDYIADFHGELCELGAHYQNGDEVSLEHIGNILGVHADGVVGHISYMIWYSTFSVEDAPIKVDYAKYHTGQSDYIYTEPNTVPLGG